MLWDRAITGSWPRRIRRHSPQFKLPLCNDIRSGKLGHRYRVAYQMRHAYSTLNLMAGANPIWVARQFSKGIAI